MKKFRTTALMVLSAIVMVTFWGCTKDNDNSNNGGNGGGSYQTKIVGEWDLVKYSTCLYDSSGTLISEEISDYDFENFRFTSEGMVSMDSWWWKSGDIVIAIYDIEGDNLKMRYTDCTIVWTIKEMTNSTMVCEEEGINGYVDRIQFKKVN